MIKKITSVTSHALDPSPPVKNCHTFADPLPLERDVFYGRPLLLVPRLLHSILLGVFLIVILHSFLCFFCLIHVFFVCLILFFLVYFLFPSFIHSTGHCSSSFCSTASTTLGTICR